MTPSARLQAGIDLLDAIIAAATSNGPAADTLIARYFRERRYAGSKDRRAVRDHVYAAIRAHTLPPVSGRAAMVALAQRDGALAALFDGSTHAPPPIGEAERSVDAPSPDDDPIPEWLRPMLAGLVDGAERSALLERAPLHLRVNALKADRDTLLAALPNASLLANTSHGIALPEGTALEAMQEWQAGLIEVQDAGSQIIAAACQAKPGQIVLDLCAGAGGKTLALAGDMGEGLGTGKGRLVAADINRDRLSRLRPRAERAGVPDIETLLLNGGREGEALAPFDGACDVVLVDAPCTGMGTWRRNPEARWRLTPGAIDRSTALQSHVLALAAPLVKPGGVIVYAVCSLLDAEGRDQVDAFLAAHVGWSAQDAGPAGRAWGQGRLLTAKEDASDGFFFARLQKA